MHRRAYSHSGDNPLSRKGKVTNVLGKACGLNSVTEGDVADGRCSRIRCVRRSKPRLECYSNVSQRYVLWPVRRGRSLGLLVPRLVNFRQILPTSRVLCRAKTQLSERRSLPAPPGGEAPSSGEEIKFPKSFENSSNEGYRCVALLTMDAVP